MSDPTAVRSERTFSAPAADVFAAWTSPEMLRRWYAPGADWDTPLAELDPRVGGRLRVAMRDPSGEVFGGGGVYREIDPPRRLVFTWTWDRPEVGEGTQLVEVEFTDNGDGTTTVLLINRGLRDEEAQGAHLDGWAASFDNLERARGGPVKGWLPRRPRWFGPTPTVDASRFQGPGEPHPRHWRALLRPWQPLDRDDPAVRETLESALEELPRPWRDVVVDRDVHGLTARETSARRGGPARLGGHDDRHRAQLHRRRRRRLAGHPGGPAMARACTGRRAGGCSCGPGRPPACSPRTSSRRCWADARDR